MTAIEIFPGHVSRLGLGSIPYADFGEYTGLQMLQRLVDGDYPAPPISERLNFALTEVGEGRAVFSGLPGVQHLNPLGGVHGGWAATIMDSALACCVHTLLERGEAYTTAEMKISYTRPITPQTGIVTCEGKVVHKGRTIAISEARLVDNEGKLLAFGTETCVIFPMQQLQK